MHVRSPSRHRGGVLVGVSGRGAFVQPRDSACPYDPPGATTSHPLEKRLKGKRVCVCVGAGGVGKTTISAALALGLAMRGKKVVVVSIDPAKRLAGALGLRELPGEPHRIEPHTLAEHGVEAARASCGR